jgi:hypothetical protein
MAISKGRSDAGQGGKRGHSNMDHWDFTEEIKLAAKKSRRLEAKSDIKEGVKEYHEDAAPRSSEGPEK